MLSKRATQQEWIDLGPDYYTSEEYQQCLIQLDRIGRFLGGDRATLWALRQLKEIPSSILDVGCGGGLFTARVAQSYPQTKVIGTDISQQAIAFATESLQKQKCPIPNVHFVVPPSCRLDCIRENYDVVMTTLVCHHLTDDDLIDFLQQACRIANQAVIINDLHRNPFAFIGFASLVPVLFRNRLIWHDGLLSIRRSFTKKDWMIYLRKAGIPPHRYTLSWHWAFRWIVMIDTAAIKTNNAEQKI